LPKHANEENELIITDGADPARAVFEVEFMPVLCAVAVAAAGESVGAAAGEFLGAAAGESVDAAAGESVGAAAGAALGPAEDGSVGAAAGADFGAAVEDKAMVVSSNSVGFVRGGTGGDVFGGFEGAEGGLGLAGAAVPPQAPIVAARVGSPETFTGPAGPAGLAPVVAAPAVLITVDGAAPGAAQVSPLTAAAARDKVAEIMAAA